MKVLLINGSPHVNGNTSIALNEMIKVFKADGVETNLVHVGGKDIRGCTACGNCFSIDRCVFDDAVNEVAPLFKEADGLVVGTPVYYSSPNGTIMTFLDRLFYSTHFPKTMKVGAGVVVCRRGGATASFDVLNKYFAMSGMPIATSQYWNMVYGLKEGEAAKDAEGLQTMRFLAQNMTFLMKAIALAKEKFGIPNREDWIPTNFIR